MQSRSETNESGRSKNKDIEIIAIDKEVVQESKKKAILSHSDQVKHKPAGTTAVNGQEKEKTI